MTKPIWNLEERPSNITWAKHHYTSHVDYYTLHVTNIFKPHNNPIRYVLSYLNFKVWKIKAEKLNNLFEGCMAWCMVNQVSTLGNLTPDLGSLTTILYMCM